MDAVAVPACVRCGTPTERPYLNSDFTVEGKTVSGPLCSDCAVTLFSDLPKFCMAFPAMQEVANNAGWRRAVRQASFRRLLTYLMIYGLGFVSALVTVLGGK